MGAVFSESLQGNETLQENVERVMAVADKPWVDRFPSCRATRHQLFSCTGKVPSMSHCPMEKGIPGYWRSDFLGRREAHRANSGCWRIKLFTYNFEFSVTSVAQRAGESLVHVAITRYWSGLICSNAADMLSVKGLCSIVLEKRKDCSILL